MSFIYSCMVSGVKPDKVKELNNILFRDPQSQTSLIPGVPLPAWIDESDIPPEYLHTVPEGADAPELDQRVVDFLKNAPPPEPPPNGSVAGQFAVSTLGA